MARVVMSASGLAYLDRIVDARAVHAFTDAVAEDMRRYVPIDTSALQGTIREEHLPGEGRVHFGDVDAGIDYHFFVENGTSKMAAQPYARPALYQRRSL